MIRRPPRSTRTDTLFPDTTLCRSLEAMVRSYAGETRKSRLRVNLLNPGAVRTKMRASAFPGEDPMTLRTPEDIAPAFVDLADPARSEERRVGKESVSTGRSGWSPDH